MNDVVRVKLGNRSSIQIKQGLKVPTVWMELQSYVPILFHDMPAHQSWYHHMNLVD
jgi:hypothetical protein